MEIRDRRVLILGGWGLVGMAIIRRLVQHQPREVVILSLTEQEAREACALMEKEATQVKFIPEWGNIFVRTTLKDYPRETLLNNPEYRHILMEDTMEALDEGTMETSFLHHVISKHKPDIIIDSVNSATALAYQDIYNSYYSLKQELSQAQETNSLSPELTTALEKLLTTLYIPQIIRHVQTLYTSMVENKTRMYIKIGTTGTGGMGLNIPYTHSEERPSRVLLSKSSLAGAHTMLLFLMARTPDGPICKEIKPAAAIAWKGIHYGEIKRRGQPIQLYDCPLDKAMTLEDQFDFTSEGNWTALGDTLRSVYIDTGENGIFSLAEFETITSAGQMEFVTPEEIAANVILEILGDSTGHDILNALNNAIMGPTYRAGYMRHRALEEMERLEQEHGVESVAFEILGPPRLSKILFEAYILRQVCPEPERILEQDYRDLTVAVEQYLSQARDVRAQILSIGIPILLRDGKHILRGPEVKIPVSLGRKSVRITPDKIDNWAYAGWVDLRESNIKLWQERIHQILDFVHSIPEDDTSSRYHHGRQYWNVEEPLNIGKLAAWIFINEEKGRRIKR